MSRKNMPLEKTIRSKLGKNVPVTIHATGMDICKRDESTNDYHYVFDGYLTFVMATDLVDGEPIRHGQRFYAWINDDDRLELSRSNPFESNPEEVDPKHLFPILQFFDYKHLPQHLQEVSKPFHDIAHKMVEDLGEPQSGPEIAAGLRKLVEAKDCMARAAVLGAKK